MSEPGQNRKSSMRAYVFRFVPESGHRAMQSACPFRAISGSHSIPVAPGEHLAPMVIRAALLAAILLLRIAKGLRAAKGPARP